MSKRRYFGTDGVRGKANRSPMTADVALALGVAAGRAFRREGRRSRALIGKDTRLSGYLIEPALTAGLISAGMDVMLLGPLPTPAVAMLTRSLRADLGVVVSASHNPFDDNGIKLFGPDGFKLADAIEEDIEALMAEGPTAGLVGAAHLGRAKRIEGARGRYVEFLKSSVPRGMSFAGLKVVIDAANGAGYQSGPTLLWELGADVIELGCEPDGFNINAAVGSTDTRALRSKVIETGAQLGVALDGDADRVIMVDENGREIDGDQLLGSIALSWRSSGRLQGGGVAATIMSNLGLERLMAELGLTLHRTKVGDRYVVEKMREAGLNVGGEQSGHIVLSDFATTGDGLLAAVQAMVVMQQTSRPLSQIGRAFEPVPQALENVIVDRPIDLDAAEPAFAELRARLGERGRLVVRPSGTEPKIRVMVEAENDTLLREALETAVGAVRAAAGPDT